ncbi:MAG: HEAT repeat domain-containing protein [Candidatus Hydrogenedentota bacterium]
MENEVSGRKQKIELIERLSTSNDPDNLARLVNFLLDDDNEIRRVVIVSLTRINREVILESFPKIEDRLKPFVAKLLQKIDTGIADKLVRDLQHMDSNRRVRAIDLMVRLGKKEGVREALKNVIKDNDSKVRASSIKAIGLLGDSRDLGDLISMVNDPDPRVRANVIEAFEKIGDDSVVWLLLRFSSDENNRIRANAMKALWHFGYKDIEGKLKKMLFDENEWMRASACWVIGELRDENLLSLLLMRLNDTSPNVRINIVRALDKIGSALCIKKLEEMQDDPSAEVRAAVINVLSRIGR